MVITWKRDKVILTYADVSIRVICKVRNELNGLRSLTENVVYTSNEDGTQGMPYMPRLFPKGVWELVSIIDKTDPYEAPEFISTNAHQSVMTWTSVDGHYGRAITDSCAEDYGYGLHNSTSDTTLGCGHIVNNTDRANLSMAIRTCWAKNPREHVYLDVQ